MNIISGLRELQRITGDETFTWKNAEVPCVARTLNATNGWETGPLVDGSTLRLYVLKENFLTVDSTLVTVDSELFTADSDMPHPVAGRKLTFRGKEWRISAAREAGTRSHYELDLISPEK